MNACHSHVTRILLIVVAASSGALFSSASHAQNLGPAPAWVQQITPGTWAVINTNRISDVDPANDPSANPNYPNGPPWRGNSGQSAVIEAWNGGALATGFGTKGSLLVWGGGHQDYYGNEVYAFDLASRAWKRVTDPFKGPINFPVADGIWPDGSPSVPHTYSQLGYHPGTNSFVTLRTMQSNLPQNVPVAAMLNLDARRWRRSRENPRYPVASGGWAVYDSSRDIFWLEGGSGTTEFTSFDPKPANQDGTFGAWTEYSRVHVGITDAMAARDPLHDILVVTAFRSSTSAYGIDLKNPDSSKVTLLQGGTPPNRTGTHGWQWSDGRQGFLYWRGGGSVYELKLAGADWRTGTWTWRLITVGTNSVNPTVDGFGPYSRFQIARYDDAEVAVVVTDVAGPVYAFRVPPTSSLAPPNPPSDVRAN